MTTTKPADELAAELFPLDECSPESTAAAGSLVAELVRHLNHATQRPRVEGTLPHPTAVYDAVGPLSTALSGLPQLLSQLAARTNTFIDDPMLAADQMGAVPDGGAPVIADMAVEELEAAAALAGELSERLSKAHARLGRLYLSDRAGR